MYKYMLYSSKYGHMNCFFHNTNSTYIPSLQSYPSLEIQIFIIKMLNWDELFKVILMKFGLNGVHMEVNKNPKKVEI